MKRLLTYAFASLELLLIATSPSAFAAQPATTHKGTPCITLTVEKGEEIRIGMAAPKPNTPVWVENTTGKYERITIGTSKNTRTYTAAGTTIRIFGHLQVFDCCGNGPALTGLTFSGNFNPLETLTCYGCSILALDVTPLKKLRSLDCSDNLRLKTLKVDGLSNLSMLFCKGNQLKSLDATSLTSLSELNCRNNALQELNVAGLAKLEALACEHNSLISLNITGLASLTNLYCYGNSFTTKALDALYCALPQRNTDAQGYIYPLYNPSDANAPAVRASNASNAKRKNWNVSYYNDDKIVTTGRAICK